MEKMQVELKLQFETHLIAVNIADRYLAHLSRLNRHGLNRLVLAVTCVLLASKLNEHSRPPFEIIKSMLSSKYELLINKKDYT